MITICTQFPSGFLVPATGSFPFPSEYTKLQICLHGIRAHQMTIRFYHLVLSGKTSMECNTGTCRASCKGASSSTCLFTVLDNLILPQNTAHISHVPNRLNELEHCMSGVGGPATHITLPTSMSRPYCPSAAARR